MKARIIINLVMCFALGFDFYTLALDGNLLPAAIVTVASIAIVMAYTTIPEVD